MTLHAVPHHRAARPASMRAAAARHPGPGRSVQGVPQTAAAPLRWEDPSATQESVMSDEAVPQSSAPGRDPLSPQAAAGLRSYAGRERARTDQLAAVLEDLAVNGLPRVEDCTPWEELRDAHYRRLGVLDHGADVA